MLGLGKLKSRFVKKVETNETQDKSNIYLSTREVVYNAVAQARVPVTSRAIALQIGWDGKRTTARLADLRRCGRIRVVFRKRGFDRVYRNYYEVVR